MELVGEAATGTEAVTQAQALRPDVVLMDLQMPAWTGQARSLPCASRRPRSGCWS